MTTSPLSTRSTAERLYQALLWIYPWRFRRIYGQEMARTFRDCYRGELQTGGGLGLPRFWCLVVSDLITSAIVEHYKVSMTFFKTLLGIEQELFMANTLHLDVALNTDIGARATNEDNMISFVPQDQQVMARKGALFVVADGLGDHTQGEVASELAVNTTREAYYQSENEDTERALQQAVEQANSAIYERNVKELGAGDADALLKKGMGTTVVAAVLHDDNVYVANAGDSLAYVIHGDAIRQIAEDHSWLAEQLRQGVQMTREQAKTEGKNNMIVRCLGGRPDLEVYTTAETVQDGDILVLCTDGLWQLVEENEVKSVVKQYNSQESVTHLIALAKERGAPDNVTAVVVHISLKA